MVKGADRDILLRSLDTCMKDLKNYNPDTSPYNMGVCGGLLLAMKLTNMIKEEEYGNRLAEINDVYQKSMQQNKYKLPDIPRTHEEMEVIREKVSRSILGPKKKITMPPGHVPHYIKRYEAYMKKRKEL